MGDGRPSSGLCKSKRSPFPRQLDVSVTVVLERWSNGALFDEDSAPPRGCNGLVILARDGRGKITTRMVVFSLANLADEEGDDEEEEL
jgi:hypothetical protein